MKFIKVENWNSNPEIKIISLNRPEVKNAFHPEMISELTDIFQQLNLDLKLKAVVLKGEGSAFCAGADLNWMQKMIEFSFEENRVDSEKLWQMFDSILGCKTPVIGVLHGAVFGGALGLVACCDYVVAAPNTQFCFSEVKLGLAPAVISSFVLKKIQDAFLRPFMLSAEAFQTEQAIQMGLVHSKIADVNEWQQVIQKFNSNGLEAMRETKKLLNQLQQNLSWSEQKNLTTKVISERRVSSEAQLRLKKFIEKK